MRSDMWWIELRSLPTPHLALLHTHSRPWLLPPFAPLSQSPLKEAPPPRVLDGGAVLDKYMTTGAGAGQMSGAEYYALVGHIKRQHGPKGEVCAPCTSLCGTATRPCHWPPLLLSPNPTPCPSLTGCSQTTNPLPLCARANSPQALETELMKITRQMDKKMRLLDWVSDHAGNAAAAAPPPQQVATPRQAATPPPQAAAPVVAHYDPPAAGTPSNRGQHGGMGGQPGGMPQISRLNLGGMGGDERVPGEHPQQQLQQQQQQQQQQHIPSGAQTARARTAMLGGGGMADLLGGAGGPPGDGSMTARPSTAQGGGGGGHLAAAAPIDNMACAEAFRGGRDHLKMSGGEYYSLVAWLMAQGFSDLESDLLKVRSMGDKKLNLVKFLKEKWGGGGGAPPHAAAPPPHHGGGAMPVDVSDGAEPMMQQMGHAQVMQMAPPQMQMAPPPQQPQQGGAGAMQAAALQQQQLAAAIATIQQAAGGGGGGLPANQASAIIGSVAALEATVTRLDESFAFAVECMQTDLSAAKAEIAKLKAMLQA